MAGSQFTRSRVPSSSRGQPVVHPCGSNREPRVRKTLEHEASVLRRVELRHQPRVYPARLNHPDIDVNVILWKPIVVHVGDLAPVLTVPLDDPHATAVLISLGVVVALVVVAVRENRAAAGIIAFVLCTRLSGP